MSLTSCLEFVRVDDVTICCRKFVGEVYRNKLFRANLGKFVEYILGTPKNLPAPTAIITIMHK